MIRQDFIEDTDHLQAEIRDGIGIIVLTDQKQKTLYLTS